MKWLISGASGLLGHSLCQHLETQGQEIVGLYNGHSVDVENVECVKVDLTDLGQIEKIISRTAPDAIVCTAGLTNVDLCESNETLAKILHADVPKAMAKSAEECEAQFVSISTDHLWDGTISLVTEETPTQPINAYARTKYLGETEVFAANPSSLVLRTNFFGPGRPWRKSFSDWIIQELTAENPITVFTDSFFTPIGLAQLCSKIQELLQRKATGVYNVAGAERLSKFEFAHCLAKYLGLRTDLIKPGKIVEAHLNAPRPSDMSLSVEKIEAFLAKKMPALDECFASLDRNVN